MDNVRSLGASAITQLPIDRLLPLIYGDLLTSSLEDFEYDKYHSLYWNSPLSYNDTHINAFLERIYPEEYRFLFADWRQALDSILLVLLTEDILVTNEEDPYRSYYWYRKGDKFILYFYDRDFGNINRESYDDLEDLILSVLLLDNEKPIRVLVSEIREKDRKVLEYIASLQKVQTSGKEAIPTEMKREYVNILEPPTEMSITPINKALGYYIQRNRKLHLIGVSEKEMHTAIYSGDDISLIHLIFSYNFDQ